MAPSEVRERPATPPSGLRLLAHMRLLAQTRLHNLVRAAWLRGVRREQRRATAAGHRPEPAHLVTGRRGELEAYFHLRRLGYRVASRRWSTRELRGDLDLVAWDGDTLVVVEVKTRTARDTVAAEFAVDLNKRQQLRKVARVAMRALPLRRRDAMPVRFDVISVYLLAAGTQIEHARNVFALRSHE